MRHVEEENKESMLQRIKRSALSGGVSGAILGAGSTALTSSLKPVDLLKGALHGAGLGSAVTGIGTGLGESLMGAPGAEESNPSLKRGALGGGVAGAVLGGLGGLALATGKLSTLSRLAPKAASAIEKFMAKEAEKGSARSGLIGKVKKLAQDGAVAHAATLGAAGGGALGAYYGGDEGLQADAVNAQFQREKEKYGG